MESKSGVSTSTQAQVDICQAQVDCNVQENRRLYEQQMISMQTNQSTQDNEDNEEEEEEDDNGNKDERMGQPLKICLSYGTQANLQVDDYVNFVFEVTSPSSTEKSTQVVIPPERKRKNTVNVVTQTYSNEASVPFAMFSDKQFTAFCGVSRQLADFLLLRAGTGVKDGRVITRKDKLCLLLAKFKLNVSFAVLGGFFGISESLAKRVFHDTLDAVYEGVKDCLV